MSRLAMRGSADATEATLRPQMTDSTAAEAGRARSWPARAALTRITGRHLALGVAVGLVLAAVVTAVAVGPSLRASGALTEVGTLELGDVAPTGQVRARGDVGENERGYVVNP